MTKTFLKQMKKKLEADRDFLMDKHYHVDIDVDGDDTDLIQGTQIASLTSELSKRDHYRLSQITNALRRIEQNQYGACEDCGEAISEKRLDIKPYIGTCISCAEQREIDQRK